MKKILAIIVMSSVLLGLTNKSGEQENGKYTNFQYYSEINNVGTRFSLGTQIFQGNFTFECDSSSGGECPIFAQIDASSSNKQQILKPDGQVVEVDNYYEDSDADKIVLQPGEKLTFDKALVGLFLSVNINSDDNMGYLPEEEVKGLNYDFKLNIYSDASAQENTNAYDYYYNKNAKTSVIAKEDLYLFTVGRDISTGYATFTCEASDTGTCSVAVDRFSTTYKLLTSPLLRPAICGYRIPEGAFRYEIPVGESVKCPYQFLPFDNLHISAKGTVNITMEQ